MSAPDPREDAVTGLTELLNGIADRMDRHPNDREETSMDPDFVNAIVRNPNDPRYPCQIGVYCDDCGTTVEADYIVHEDDDQETRFGYARRHLRTLGWVCDETGDHCADCATKGGSRV